MPTGQANRLMPTLRRVVLARQSAARSDGELLGAFVNARDTDAFAELVRRHGPMVLGVCRRVVGDPGTAEDAFQAVFLVLARRAAAVRPREQVGNWLYGVAYRTALKARVVLARRRSREKQVDVMPEPTAPAAPATADWADLQPVIDEELAKLPDKLRVPVVLCDLEGRPQRDVARHLNLPAATLATRLATARRTLAQRLTRRGVTLSGGALAGLLGMHGAAGAVPPALTNGVFRLGEAVATGAAVNTLVSVQAVQLSEGVMQMMMLAKLKAVAVVAATALMLTTGLGVGLVPALADDRPAGLTTALAARPAQPPGSSDKQSAGKPNPAADDMTFLRRLCLDVRGTLPTDVEQWFFVSDQDDDKRAKVVEWMVADDEAKVIIARKLGVPPERVKIVRARLSADGKFVEVTLEQIPALIEKRSELIDLEVNDKHLVAGSDPQNVAGWLNRLAVVGQPVEDRQRLAVVLDDAKTIDRAIQLKWVGDKAAADNRLRLWSYLDAGDDAQPQQGRVEYIVRVAGSDAEFLKRVLTDVRGSGPTALETKYFTEDKDPKKREKLLDTLLKDPAVQKKLGAEWKQKMLSFKVETLRERDGLLLYQLEDVKPAPGQYRVVPVQPQPPKPPTKPKSVEVELVFPKPPTPPKPPEPAAGKFDKLVNELLAAQKSDEAILEALTLATQGRLPTDVEKKLTLAGIATAKDRKTAWVAIARALAGSDAKAEWRKVEVELKPSKP